MAAARATCSLSVTVLAVALVIVPVKSASWVKLRPKLCVPVCSVICCQPTGVPVVVPTLLCVTRRRMMPRARLCPGRAWRSDHVSSSQPPPWLAAAGVATSGVQLMRSVLLSSERVIALWPAGCSRVASTLLLLRVASCSPMPGGVMPLVSEVPSAVSRRLEALSPSVFAVAIAGALMSHWLCGMTSRAWLLLTHSRWALERSVSS